MTSHRRDVRPRYGRIAVLAASVTVSAVAALAGFGVLTSGSAQAGAGTKPASYTSAAGDAALGAHTGVGQTGGDPVTPPAHQQSTQGTSTGTSSGTSPSGDPSGVPPVPTQSSQGTSTTNSPEDTALPAGSGQGRRIVFSQSQQRVWLVDDQTDSVQRTYLVSGSVTDNLQPGTYSVYSKSRWAVGIDDSGVMQYFVRFTQGPTGAAIGFHSIPTKNGVPLQTRAQLGTPESHGCIRQYLPNAIALWNFAPIGTKVVVVA
jgi:lipoprotein-anchoring transpeptidase ErfK/SrfK